MVTKRYEESGVSIQAGDELVKRIKGIVQSTFGKGVIGGVGSFSALFAIDKEKYDEPVLVSGTDSVGTKVKIATLCEKYDTVGIDVVAMCVNDILTSGAKPLFFLDYLATSKLKVKQGEEIVKGVAEGCREAQCSLIGGETAEMPGIYLEGEFDLVGFCVGIVERKKIVDGSRIKAGDIIFGIPSSGLHSNGYSLVRKVLLDEKRFKPTDEIAALGCNLGEELLRPTRIYTGSISELMGKVDIHGMAHITGGGWYGNIPRILPEGCRAVISKGSWDCPPIFNLLKTQGKISEDELFTVFNMGIGFVVIIGKEDEDKLAGQNIYKIGEVKEGKKGLDIV
ncbi:Phosphoribosylformylglycinamidine cyclo-ligase [subsurface metagenome]